MRILLITQWFQPESFYKGIPFAKALIERGHQIQVLTGFPNYPTGKIFPGYKVHLFQKEVMEGIEVLRVPLYPSHDSSSLGRIANYLSFALSASILGPWVVKKADVVYVYHPPATAYLPAFFIKLFRRIPVVYDIQDFWPDTLAATGMFNKKWALKVVDCYCRLFYKVADKIAVLSPGFKRKLIEKNVPADKVEIIYNWFDDKEIVAGQTDMKLAQELGMAGRFNILFAGNMGKAQRLETVLDAAEIVQQKKTRIQFVFIGGGVEVENLKTIAKNKCLSNVCFLPPRPPSQISPVLSLADVLLVHLRSDPLFEITIPSKIQAYMAVGKPILSAVPGDASELVNWASAGLCCPSQNPQQLAEVVMQMYQMPPEELHTLGENGKIYYYANMTMSKGVEKFEKMFESVIYRHKQARS